MVFYKTHFRDRSYLPLGGFSCVLSRSGKLAGVALQLSRASSKNKSTISDETKKRVREAMVGLVTIPTLMLAVLSANLVQVVALVLPIDSDESAFFPAVFRRDHPGRLRQWLCYPNLGQNEERRLDNLQATHLRSRVDGYDFLSILANDPLVDFAIKDQPLLILQAASPFVSLVDNDNIKATFDATNISFNKTTEKLRL